MHLTQFSLKLTSPHANGGTSERHSVEKFFTWNQFWKFETFSFTLNWREISYGESKISKTTILMISDALNFDFCHLWPSKMYAISQRLKFRVGEVIKNKVHYSLNMNFWLFAYICEGQKWQKSKFIAPEIAKLVVFKISESSFSIQRKFRVKEKIWNFQNWFHVKSDTQFFTFPHCGT